MGPEKFESQDGSTSRKALASSSSGAAAAGLSEREGATEAMDGTRLGGIVLDGFLAEQIQVENENLEFEYL